MLTLHKVSKSHTTGSIRSVLKMPFDNIKHINLRRCFDHYFVSPIQEKDVMMF